MKRREKLVNENIAFFKTLGESGDFWSHIHIVGFSPELFELRTRAWGRREVGARLVFSSPFYRLRGKASERVDTK